MALGLKYKNEESILEEAGTVTPFLEFPLFKNTGIVRHGFSTRLGGVSKGYYSSMNLSFERGDDPEAVRVISPMTRRQSVKISGVWELQSEFPVRIWYFQSRRILQMSGL